MSHSEFSTAGQIFSSDLFEGKRALIVGVANERSLAWSIARHLGEGGARLGFTYYGEQMERRVRPLAESVNADLVEPCDVASDAQIDQVFQTVKERWGGLDILVHAVGFAKREELEGGFLDTSREGFRVALDISAYSLIALAKRAEPLMANNEASILALTFYGAEKVIPHYNVMGVAKAALEASVRYLAHELGPKKIRVNAISAGPVRTLATTGLHSFDWLLANYEEKSPLRENISADDVGAMAAFLCGQGARHMTGCTLHVDGGFHIMGM